MDKKETRNKKRIVKQNPPEEQTSTIVKPEGFPEEVDFKKFLGCGG